jgi:hypothetical protein
LGAGNTASVGGLLNVFGNHPTYSGPVDGAFSVIFEEEQPCINERNNISIKGLIISLQRTLLLKTRGRSDSPGAFISAITGHETCCFSFSE